MATDGEKIAVIETKIEALHQDLHLVGNQIDSCTRSIEGLRNALHGRPSWGITFALTFMSSTIVALAAALVAVAT